ncbi:MAG TPA: tetratricopeptide repeat protein [Anaerolineae bacterium]|nr:tetratricopeptide repeat protein [Anaerolineae bacterium]
MAGNRLRFDDAIQKANDLVWAEKWDDAVKAYRRALAEFPDDVSTLLGYAWALLNASQTDEALAVYERLITLNAADPGPYERIAEIREKRGEAADAATMYFEAAQRYKKQNLGAKMTASLEATVRLTPNNDRAWAELLQQYQREREVDKAVQAALWLAYLYQDDHHDWAVEVCRQMQQFIPHEPLIGQAMMLLQSNRGLPKPAAAHAQTDATSDEFTEGVIEDAGSPVDIARQRALAKLAESIFDEDKPQVQGLSQMEVDMLIGKAIDAQTRGDYQVSQQAYEQLLQAGVSMPSIHFNLGLLYKEQMRFSDAIVQFERSITDPEYVLSSNYTMGECYQAQGNFKQALQYFLEAVKIVDLATIEHAQANDLIRVYEGLAQNLINTGEPERIQQLGETLVNFLGQRGWEEESIKARKRLDGMARSGVVLSLGELISLSGSEDVLKSLAMAQEYQRRHKVYNALEELFHAIGKAPDYLPLHHLLATLFQETGNIEQSVEKLHTIASAHEIRGETPQALATYHEILQISPLDINVHKRVIDLMVQHGRIDDALNQYRELADAYYQLAQPERARETYVEALRVAPRGTDPRQWEVRILHKMADLDMQRLNWQAAIKSYEEIVRIAPDDERAHLGLFRLYPRTGRPHLGMGALDKLIRHHLEKQRVDKVLAILEDLMSSEPDNPPLRARAAQLYLNMGNRDKALEHLDILGDLQLEAGQKDAASKTIEAILALNPPNRQDYVELYREMTGREPPAPRGTGALPPRI